MQICHTLVAFAVVDSEAREWRHNSDKLRQTNRYGERIDAFPSAEASVP